MLANFIISMLLTACIDVQAVAVDTQEPIYCTICNEVVDEPYQTKDGNVCKKCFNIYYVCGACGKPLPIHASDGYACKDCEPDGEYCQDCGYWIPYGYDCAVCAPHWIDCN